MVKHTQEKMRVLFFGRSGCKASKTILNKLIKFNYSVTVINSKARGELIPEDILKWEGDYIFCYRSFLILPFELIKKARVAAVNFHPAPPEYPGSGCINFAIYDDVSRYGVTAHFINEKIDNGEIIEVRRFPIFKNDNLSKLLTRTHEELFNLCSDFIDGIFYEGTRYIKNKISESKGESWVGLARKISELDNLKHISPMVDKKELDRVVRATYIKEFPPKIILHGYEFFLDLGD